MEQKITRTITTYVYPISAITISETGEDKAPDIKLTALEAITTYKPLSTKELRRKADEIYPVLELYFHPCRESSVKYEMALSDFLYCAKPVVEEPAPPVVEDSITT